MSGPLSFMLDASYLDRQNGLRTAVSTLNQTITTPQRNLLLVKRQILRHVSIQFRIALAFRCTYLIARYICVTRPDLFIDKFT